MVKLRPSVLSTTVSSGEADVIDQAGVSPGAPLTRIVCAGDIADPVVVAPMSIDVRLSVSCTLLSAVTKS